MSDIRQIKDKLTAYDVLQRLSDCEVPKRTNKNFRCPFPESHSHGDADPSCSMWLDKRGIRCFGCDYSKNLFDLVKDKLRYSVSQTIQWFKENFPELRLDEKSMPRRMKAFKKEVLNAEVRSLQDLKPLSTGKLRKGSQQEIRWLARNLGLGDAGLNLAQRFGSLRFYVCPAGDLRWVVLGVLDGKVYGLQERRVDGQTIVLKDGRHVKCRTLGKASIPIGLHGDLKENIILCEGATDLLAAYQQIWGEGVEKYFSPVAMLGASQRIPEFCLERFVGRNVLLFPDNDAAGIRGCDLWCRQLEIHAKFIKTFDFGSLKTDHGNQIKDLRDFMQIDVDCWENNEEAREPLSAFLRAAIQEVAHE